MCPVRCQYEFASVAEWATRVHVWADQLIRLVDHAVFRDVFETALSVAVPPSRSAARVSECCGAKDKLRTAGRTALTRYRTWFNEMAIIHPAYRRWQLSFSVI